MATKKQTAATAASTPATENLPPAVPAPEAPLEPAAEANAAAGAPPATEELAALENSVADVAESGSAPIIPGAMTLELQEQPPPVDDLVTARVLSLLVHDGVSYPEGGIVTLTAAQHAELWKAGVVSSEPAEDLPY